MHTPEQWRGVVAPNKQETSLLLHELIQFDNEGLFYRIAHSAYQTRPQLEDTVNYALNFYENIDYDKELFMQEDFEKYIDGLSEGTDFMIGCMAYIEIMRSSTPISEAIEHLDDFLPTFSPATIGRFKQVISGNAIVDVSWMDYDPEFNSSQLPTIDMGELLFEYPLLSAVFDEATKGYDFFYHAGFMGGAELILSLYLQNAEEKIGTLLDN